ncbi:TrmH family RNA methyltransferase [Ideonella livida]|uniref:RNA methyltransferase n=1 Tax=Ideonella livida TaxID=2707176 RepID=A0A7C9PFK0_9BURK|nr:RNA methyltransferase [Ideonella livida]NDY90676.1 RNA methyltransferase [Ideonella livida]
MSADPKLISSAANPLVKLLRRLATEPTAYRRQGQVWLEGDHLARALLARGRQARLGVMTAQAWEGQAELRTLWPAAAEWVLVETALMAGLSGLESPPPMGLLADLADLAPKDAAAGTAAVVLDRLQDAGNVGTILRTAAAMGVCRVLALKGTAALWSPKVLRAGMGAHFALHLQEGLSLEAVLGLDVPLVATSSYAAQPLHRTRLPQPCAWVFGHEGQGIGAELLAACPQRVMIPQPGGEESLNVGAAAAICLYESARQRLG